MNEDLKTILNEVYAHYDYKYGKVISEILEENERLQKRIDKAIEYIKHFSSDEICENITGIAKILLEILGGNNE